MKPIAVNLGIFHSGGSTNAIPTGLKRAFAPTFYDNTRGILTSEGFSDSKKHTCFSKIDAYMINIVKPNTLNDVLGFTRM